MTNLSEIKAVADEIGSKFDLFKKTQDERFELVEKDLIGLARGRAFSGAASGGGDTAAKSALKAYVTKGDESQLAELQSKSMQTGVDADGGFSVPTFIDETIENLERDASAIMRLANQVDALSSTYKKVVNLGGTGSGWVGETAARPATEAPKMAEVEIVLGELYANPQASQRILDDSAFDIEAFISTEIGDVFADQLGDALINGNGTNKPKGILTYTVAATGDKVRAFGTLQAVSTDTTLIVTFDDLKALKSSLRAKYRTGAAFVMNEETALSLSLIKDLNGAYVWRDAVAEGEPDTLLGYPVEIDENMPDIAKDAYPVIFGNFQRGYTIARRKGVRILRDPYTNKPFVSFYATDRVGGGVVNSDCIKLLKVI